VGSMWAGLAVCDQAYRVHQRLRSESYREELKGEFVVVLVVDREQLSSEDGVQLPSDCVLFFQPASNDNVCGNIQYHGFYPCLRHSSSPLYASEACQHNQKP
jgi:hypothetical protein